MPGVCSGKGKGLTLDAVVFFDVGGPVEGFLVGVVPDGDVGAGFGEGLGDGETDACAGAGDDGRFAFVGEEGEDLFGFGGRGVVVREVAAFHCRVGHFCELGVLEGDDRKNVKGKVVDAWN